MKEVVRLVNICDKNNKQLRHCFIFFFFISICAYLSIIVSSDLYRDDFVRNIGNYPVGVWSGGRYVTLIIELVIYLSNVITLYAPFSYILSCLFLSYSAVLCLKIFKVDINNKWKILIFSVLFANPYMVENMMYRFDNPYMSFAMFLVIIAAYLTSQHSVKQFWIPGLFLLTSLFVYQPAFPFYCIIALYLTLLKIRKGTKALSVIIEMKYWIIILLLTVLCYVPFSALINYCRNTDGAMFLIPNNIENVNIIIGRMSDYLKSIYQNWEGSAVGQIYFVLIGIFILHNILITFDNTKSLVSLGFILIIVLLMILSPNVILFCLKEDVFVYPRKIYSISLILALVLYDNYRFFCRFSRIKIFYNCVIISLVLWNLIFFNSVGNIKHQINMIQDYVLYDLSKDIEEILCSNENISRVYIDNHHCLYPIIANFEKEYPFVKHIMYEYWNDPDYCKISAVNYKFVNMWYLNKCRRIAYKADEYKTKILVKSHMCYDIFVQDNKLIYISFKGVQTNDCNKLYALVRAEANGLDKVEKE